MDTMNTFTYLIDLIAYYSWSPLSILLLVGTGLLLTLQFHFIQLRYFTKAFKVLISGKKSKRKSTKGDDKLSGFQALSTVLSGTIGTGNIAGVATAIVVGGPGTIFWMWVTGFLGMATKFTSCTLGHYYRRVDANNKILGGPMITLMYGLKYHKLAKMFAFFMILGTLSTGSMVQANSITEGISYLIPSLENYRLILGLIISLLAGIVIIGGVKRIAHVAEVIVPFMASAYVLTALFILCLNYKAVPSTFMLIFEHAFSIQSIAGTSIWLVVRSGVSRGLFASEAGLGTAPIAIATLDTDKSVEAGFIGMIGPVFDTLILCTMTGFIILATGAYHTDTPSLLNGAQLSQKAFELGLGEFGQNSAVIATWVVGLSLVLFAYTTILTWSYYGDRCVSFLFGEKYIFTYRVLLLLILTIGSVLNLRVVWDIADIANIGIAIPNLISLLLLRKKVAELLKNYVLINQK